MSQHPPTACLLWLNGDKLTIQLPGANGAHHVVHIPLDKLETSSKDPAARSGWHTLALLLRARAQSTPLTRTIGHKAAPVQYDIEQVRRYNSRGKPASVTLADLDLGD